MVFFEHRDIIITERINKIPINEYDRTAKKY